LEGADRRRQLLGIAHLGILPIPPKGHAMSPHQPTDKPDQPDYLPAAGTGAQSWTLGASATFGQSGSPRPRPSVYVSAGQRLGTPRGKGTPEAA
jgi:hypothetical protein